MVGDVNINDSAAHFPSYKSREAKGWVNLLCLHYYHYEVLWSKKIKVKRAFESKDVCLCPIYGQVFLSSKSYTVFKFEVLENSVFGFDNQDKTINIIIANFINFTFF